MGQFVTALKNCPHDLNKVKLLMPSAGDACRGSNYVTALRRTVEMMGLKETVKVLTLNMVGIDPDNQLVINPMMLWRAFFSFFYGDILKKGGEVQVRKRVHVAMAGLMVVTILVFNALNSTSAIDAVYKLASYTYGPILGLFAFGILTKKQVKDRYVPVVALIAPAVCLVLQLNSERWFGGYKFSYELLLVNAALTFLGLCLLIRRDAPATRQ
jgi:hypothetical protein